MVHCLQTLYYLTLHCHPSHHHNCVHHCHWHTPAAVTDDMCVYAPVSLRPADSLTAAVVVAVAVCDSEESDACTAAADSRRCLSGVRTERADSC